MNGFVSCKFDDAMHKNCFARKDGKCICLRNCEFKSGRCPFYKSEERIEKEKKAYE